MIAASVVKCIICDQPTETGLAFEGDAHYLIRAAMVLGLSQGQATELLSRHTGMSAFTDPQARTSVVYPVCVTCSTAADPGMQAPGPLSGQVPLFRQEDQ